MAQLNDLLITGKTRALNPINGSCTNGTTVTTQTQSTKFMREDGTWSAPSYTTIGTTATTAMAGNTNVNNVTQTATTTSANYEILFSGTADNTTRAEGVRKSGGITFNPSDVKLKVGSSESNTMITGLSVSVSGILHGGCNVTMTGDDITIASSGNTQTWDGTNTSLVTAVTSAKGTVTQTNTAVSSAASYYNILFSNAAADTTTRTDSVRKSAYLFFDTKDSTLTTGNLVASSTVYAADVSNLTSTWDGTNTSLKTAISSLANRKYIYGSWRETSNKTGTGSSHPTIQSFSFTTTGRPLVIILSAPISVSRYTGSIRLIMDNSGILEASTNSQTMFRATNMIIKTDVAAGTHNFVLDLSAQDSGTTTTLYSYNPYSVMMFEL